MEGRLIKQKKYSLYQLGNIIVIFRVFWNAVIAYLCIYIDIVIAQPGTGPDNNRRIVLIAIAIYSTIQITIKLALALGHHLKFLLTCCQAPMAPGRKEQV